MNTAQQENKFIRQAEESLDFEVCRRNAHHFIFGDHCGEYMVTKDEHDVDAPVKPFPDLEYLRVILDLLLVSGKLAKPEETLSAERLGYDRSYLEFIYSSGILFLEKSRQMLITWIVCAYLLWRAKFKPHQLLMVQSKREDDAANLVYNKEPHVARMSFLESNLPKHLRTVDWPKGGAFGHLFFPNGSHVWAIPEGGDIVRSNSPSVVFSDESAFQPQFGASYTAALPAVKGGGQYVAVSSAEPGEFQSLVEST